MTFNAELAQTATVGPAERRERPPRHNQHGQPGSSRERQGNERKDEPQGSRTVAMERGHYLVQRPTEDARATEVAVNFPWAEREVLPVGLARALQPRQAVPKRSERGGLGRSIGSHSGHGSKTERLEEAWSEARVKTPARSLRANSCSVAL